MSEEKRPKQIVFRPRNEHEQKTLQLLSETYPHMNGADRIGELLQQWRLRKENNNTKEAKLDMILHVLFEMLQYMEQHSGITFPAAIRLQEYMQAHETN